MSNIEFSQKPLFKKDSSYEINNQKFKIFHINNKNTIDIDTSQVAAIILAGGKARRFGHKNKALLELAGMSFLDRIMNELSCFRYIYMSVAKNYSNIDNAYLCINDMYEDKGPLGAMASVMQYIKERYAFFIPCDMPLITKEMLLPFVEIMQETNCDAVVATDSEGKIHPLCCLINKSAKEAIFDQLEKDDLRMLNLFKRLNTYSVEVDSRYLININTEEDLKIAEQCIATKQEG